MLFDLICIDMFQTLVDVNTRIPFIWKGILQEKYSEERQNACVKLVSSKVISVFHESRAKSTEFSNIRTLFTPSFREIAEETQLGFNPERAVDIFLLEHGNASLYDDSKQFFTLIGQKIPISLVSDADTIMVQPLLNLFNFDSVFISEDIQSYKNDSESKIFHKVLEYYLLKPDRVLHIGDSSSDILGAHKVGIKTCWINRNNHNWEYNSKPDYTVKSLVDVIKLLR